MFSNVMDCFSCFSHLSNNHTFSDFTVIALLTLSGGKNTDIHGAYSGVSKVQECFCLHSVAAAIINSNLAAKTESGKHLSF